MAANDQVFWAHSDPFGRKPDHPESKWQRLSDHLVATGNLAGRLARDARPDDLSFHRASKAVGLLHDVGKYTDAFQARILGSKVPAPHSAYGAAIAANLRGGEAAFAIAGHHSGLSDKTGLLARIAEVEAERESIAARAIADCPQLAECFDEARPLLGKLSGGGSADLRTRMLFSCLIDADRLDSAGEDRIPAPLLAHERLSRLRAKIAERASEVQEGIVKVARSRVLEACLAAAERPERLLSLTVPTGGGKTLASVAFALRKAEHKPETVRRIIIVIPFLSIIEQNAKVLADALGADAILEHHSGSHYKLREANERFVPVPGKPEFGYCHPLQETSAENWDAPIIVTTSVRFFESLFSNRPRDLRRMHNVARSVVILDEVQTLPRELLAPSLAMMRELSQDWETTFVFCTATQPAFERSVSSPPTELRWKPGTIREIIPDPPALFRQLKRVVVDESNLAAPLAWPEVARRMLAEPAALAIVNVRDHAAELYKELRRNRDEFGIDSDAIFHLSTRMCGAHRLDTIARIRKRLKAEKPCYVASTQLVEAGVDLDFPVVYRALAPLDSIAQAAGRCDREGKLTARAGMPGGHVIVFRTEDGKTPPGAYKEATERTSAMFAAGLAAIDDPASLRLFFERYYGEGADLGGKFLDWRKDARFSEIADHYHLIEDGLALDVFVPYGEEGRALCRSWI